MKITTFWGDNMKQKRNKILSIIQILTGIITIMIGIATLYFKFEALIIICMLLGVLNSLTAVTTIILVKKS
jgi:uncharacterized membrane protein HdeD (DUF308 family)